jgi:hypothetical protein
MKDRFGTLESFRAPALVAVLGIVLRMNAVAIAWPKEYSFSGDRSDTSWAQAERGWIHISIAVIALAIGMALVSWHHVLQARKHGDAQDEG